MKVLFAHDHRFIKINNLYYSGGALPTSVWERFLQSFNEVTVVARYGGTRAEEHTKSLALSSREDVSFHLIPSLSNLQGLLGVHPAIKEIHTLVSNHDAVVARLGSSIGLAAIAAARKQQKPYAIELVDTPFEGLWNYGSLIAKAYAPFSALRTMKAVYQSDFVLYVTKQFLQRRAPHHEHAITVACSNVHIPPPHAETINKRFKKIEKQQKQITLGMIASLAGKIKGLHILLPAFAKVRKEHPHINLKILGAGDPNPWKNMAKELGILEFVEFSGVLPAGEPVLQWLDSIDLYVHPSLREGLPRAVIEAMSRGCPVIASSVAGTPELLPVDYLVPKGNTKALVDKIDYVLLNRRLWPDIARENFERSKEYTDEVLKLRRQKFYAQLAEAAKKSANPCID